MPSCDMCGKSGRLVRSLIEGTELTVCPECARFGKPLARPVTFIKKDMIHKQPAKPAREELVEMIVPEYSLLIKSKRAEMNLTQEELASKLAEKLSIIQKVENGQMEPPIVLARKIEKLMGITIVEKFDDKVGALSTKTKTAEFTIGDAVRIKHRIKDEKEQ